MLAIATVTVHANDSPKALQEAFLAALRDNDAQGLAACYAKDAVNFPLDALVQTGGPEAVRADWERFFAGNRVLKIELAQDHLEVHGDTAIAWGLFSLLMEPAEGGEAVEMTGRYMDVARNIDGQWLYVADHASVPLAAPESGAAAD